MRIALFGMASPQTLCRGKLDLSINTTLNPARAKPSAAVDPPGPAPTMATSKSCAVVTLQRNLLLLEFLIVILQCTNGNDQI